jgi:hypothetical protein
MNGTGAGGLMETDGDYCAAYDPYSPEVKADPYPFYAALQASCPVHYLPKLDMYTLTRFADVVEVLRRNEMFSSARGPSPEHLPSGEGLTNILVLADDPVHARQRKLVNWAFTPRRLQALEAHIEALSHDLFDQFVERGTADFVAEYAYQLPVTVIGELFGMPEEDRKELLRWSQGVVKGMGLDDDKSLYMNAVMEFAQYLFQQATDRRKLIDGGEEPPDDLLTALLEARADTDQLSDVEFVGISILILGAGHETTTSLLANLVYLLCSHPAERAKLETHPDLIENAVEEALRYLPPVPGLCRTNNEGVEIAGTEITPNTKIHSVLSAANRDPSCWGSDAGDFRVDRALKDVRQHLSFGFGVHYCLGAPLARMQGRIALRHILDRLPGLTLDPDCPPQPRHDFIIRGWETMPIRFTPTVPRNGSGS